MFAVIPKKLLKNVRSKITSGYLNSHMRYSAAQSLVNGDTTSSVRNYEKSFAVSYLIESCGLSEGNAILAAGKVQFKTPEGPDAVLALLKKQGFLSTHIAEIVKKRPSLLLTKNPEKSLLSKFEFLRSIGMSGNKIINFLTNDPSLLRCSLVKKIIPYYNIVKSVVEIDEGIHRSLRRLYRVSKNNLQTSFIPNLTLLRELGAPKSSIALLVSHYSPAAFMPNKKFVETVEELKGMGFDPRTSMFVLAINVFTLVGRRKAIEKKFETYIQWGWSADEALMAFRRQPHCMLLSDQNIQMKMDLLINKMGWSPDFVARYPAVLSYSLEKRVMPRCSVFEVLVSRNLVKKNLSIGSLMGPNDETFMKRFVTKYLGGVPQLMDVYQGKIDPSALVIDSGET